MSYLFIFRTYPDVDHMVPLVWRLLEEGEDVHAVISPGYDISGDHRLAFVARYPNFHVHEVGRSRLRATVPYALATLLRRRVRVVAVEWGYGLAEGYDKLASLAGVRAVARSIVRSFRKGWGRDPRQPRTSYVVAARLLRRPVVSLPHGLSIKLDAATSDDLVKAMSNGGLDWRDRNRFTRVVFNTEHHRQLLIDHTKGDPAVMETWGSLRWDRTWFELNRTLVPPYDWPEPADRLKVVFMLPKWKNRVHVDAVVELVRTLHRLPFVSLAIKGHARPQTGDTDPLRSAPDINWDRIQDVGKVDSVALIAAADAVLDVGSSIGIEVVLQGKVLVNPAYIHELRTLFDEIEGSCVVAGDVDEVVAALERIRDGDAPRPAEEAVDELLRRAVYAERQPYDVSQLYLERFQELATGRTR